MPAVPAFDIISSLYQMISMASTKKVVINGRISVSQGQWVTIATPRATQDNKNNNQ